MTDKNEFGSQFDPVPVTPAGLVNLLDYDDRNLASLTFDGERYRLTDRFHRGLAKQLDVPYKVFNLFTPEEVMKRAAKVCGSLKLRVTLDRDRYEVLGLTERRGVPVPVRHVVSTLRGDHRIRDLRYKDGVVTGRLDLGDGWEVPNDGEYRVHVQCRVPVDGLEQPEMNLATWRLVCANGAIAEAPIFRTKLEIKDNDGGHFKRLVASFSNPEGVELLQERMGEAASTRASVGELLKLEAVIKRAVPSSHDQRLLRDRLHEVAENPCLRYGVTDLDRIGEKRRPLLPVDCSVSDLLNFASEIATHHGDIVSDTRPLHAFAGTLLAKGFDLEGLYPSTRRASRFYVNDLALGGKVA